MLLTQRTAFVRKRFTMVMVLCGLLAGIAVAGIPDAIAGGSISDGCFAEGTSSLDSKTPDNTSIADPFDLTRTDSVAWTGRSAGVFTDWESSIGMKVGGFPVEIWSGSSANEGQKQSNSGVEDVAGRFADIEESTGITLAGVYLVYGNLDANEGGCDMSAYVRVEGEGAFTGTLNVALWIAVWVLVLIIGIMAGVVRHSITRSAFPGGGASAAAAATDPSPTENRAKDDSPRGESGRQAESGRQSESKTQRPERTPKDTADGQDPMPGGDEVMETGATGDGVADTEEPGASSPSDEPDAPQSGDDKPAG